MGNIADKEEYLQVLDENGSFTGVQEKRSISMKSTEIIQNRVNTT